MKTTAKIENIVGTVWKFGSNIDTDQIIPAEYLTTGNHIELGRHAFEKSRPGFVKDVKVGDILVADDNFGCGSSREHAPRALLGIGISCVVAKSFARIFFRNAINIGLPIVECNLRVNETDKINIDLVKGTITNLNDNNTFNFKPLPNFLLELLKSDGLVGYTKRSLNRVDI